MTKCKFVKCLKTVPNERKKYCSTKCVKRAWYIKNGNFKSSYFKNRKQWLKTETGKGYIWEKFVANLLNGKWQGLSANYDIYANGEKIDVKTCNLYKRKTKRGNPVKNIDSQTGWWVFNRNINKGAEYFFCIGLVDNKPLKMFKIPAEDFGGGITITPIKSKYDRYQVYL